MIDRDDVIDALTKCSGYDPVKFPTPSDIIVDAWLEHLQQFRVVTRDDLLHAVTRYYNQPDRKVPQPADISQIARLVHKEMMDEDELAAEHEAICDWKAGDPPRDRRKVNNDPEVVAARRAQIAQIITGIAERRAIQKAHSQPSDGSEGPKPPVGADTPSEPVSDATEESA